MVLNQLYGWARPIPKELEFINKYTWLGVNKVLPVKYLDVNDVLTNMDVGIRNYIIKNEAVLLFPNIVNGIIIDIFVKPIFNKAEPLKLGSNALPYNIGQLQASFRYGEPIILVEGIADVAALKLMSPEFNVIAMQSSRLNNNQIELLSLITNNIIVLPDRDDAGKTGLTKMWYRFRELKTSVVALEQFRYFKDTGDFLDKVLYFQKTGDHSTLDEIDLAWKYYKTAVESEQRNMR